VTYGFLSVFKARMLWRGRGFVRAIISFAKFAASGKVQAKKNLGLMQMQYKDVYVAYVSMGTNPAATVKAFNEAENYNGPYSPRRRRARRLRGVRSSSHTRAGPCGRLRRFATFHSKQSFFRASQVARQEDRPGQGDGDAQEVRTGRGPLRAALPLPSATCPSKPQAVSSAHLKENYALLKKLAEM